MTKILPLNPYSSRRDEPGSRPRKSHATNIEAVVRLEKEQDRRIPGASRLSEAIGKFAGTNGFVVLQLAIVLMWITINGGLVRGVPVFDPFPFPFLGLLLTLEAVLLTSFVLIRQNRMSQKADERSHLDLQINLLAEKETTKVIQLLQRISDHFGIKEKVIDPEAHELSKDTEVEDVARDLRKNLEKDEERST